MEAPPWLDAALVILCLGGAVGYFIARRWRRLTSSPRPCGSGGCCCRGVVKPDLKK